jgi:hypothetical protein
MGSGGLTGDEKRVGSCGCVDGSDVYFCSTGFSSLRAVCVLYISHNEQTKLALVRTVVSNSI